MGTYYLVLCKDRFKKKSLHNQKLVENKSFFVSPTILIKLCEIVVPMSTTISQCFIKIGGETRIFYSKPIFSCVNFF